MQHRAKGFVLALGLLSFTALPASAQMWGFPDYAVPSATTGPATFLAGTYGRGLNDASGKLDAFGAVLGRTGEVLSFMGGVGMVSGGADDEITVGGAVGADVVHGESATLALQGGVGWMDSGNTTMWRFPLGVAVKGYWESPEATIAPWVLPKLNISRVSNDFLENTETDFGTSVGVAFGFASGFGVHTALDVIFAENEVWTYGIGGHYILGGS